MSFLRKWGVSAGSGVTGAASQENVKREWHNEVPGERYFGLENFGNTCYANSVLQALYFSKPFREFVETCVTEPEPSTSSSPMHASTSAKTIGSGLAIAAAAASSSSPGKKAATNGKVGTSAGKSSLASAFGGHRRQASQPSPRTDVDGTSSQGSELGSSALNASSNKERPEPTDPPPGTKASEPTLLTTLHDLFVAISSQTKTTGTVAPQAFINQLKKDNEFYRSTSHQDAHEFLNYLVNVIAEAVEKEDKKAGKSKRPASHSKDEAATWVHRLFEGILTNETRCLTCETVSSRDEAFLDLSIDIEPNSSLTACLRQFGASEMLCQRNKFSCDRCCGLQEAEKRMKIKKLPNILALHLKRFKYEESLQRHIKLTYRVVFPFELRLFNTADGVPNPDRLYRLWAIIVHIGITPHHGHYITIIKTGSKWVLFDDGNVTPMEESDIQKFYGDTPGQGSGYVLFYQAADLTLEALGLVQANGHTTAGSISSSAPTADGHASSGIRRQTLSGLGTTAPTETSVDMLLSPPADAAHSLFPAPDDFAASADSSPARQSESLLYDSAPSEPKAMPRSLSVALPSYVLGESDPPTSVAAKEHSGGMWGLRGKKSMTAKGGRGLSLSSAGIGSAKGTVSGGEPDPPPIITGDASDPLRHADLPQSPSTEVLSVSHGSSNDEAGLFVPSESPNQSHIRRGSRSSGEAVPPTLSTTRSLFRRSKTAQSGVVHRSPSMSSTIFDLNVYQEATMEPLAAAASDHETSKQPHLSKKEEEKRAKEEEKRLKEERKYRDKQAKEEAKRQKEEDEAARKDGKGSLRKKLSVRV